MMGAPTASGSKNSMAAHMISKNPKAIYTHCFYHRLKLSICKTCQIQRVSNIMEQIKEWSYFLKFFRAKALFVARMNRIISTRCR